MKKRVLSILLALGIVMCGLFSLVLWSATADEMHNVTVKAAVGGKVSTDGTNWSDRVVVSVAKGATLGDRVQYKPDEGYKLDGVTAATVIKKIVASATNTAAIDDAGNLYTAGDNSRGQLARTLDFYVDEDSVLTKVSTSAKTVDVALGTDHIVVLDENGDVWTAGCNQYGALGIDENAGKYWYGTYIETLRKVTVGNGSVKIKAVAAGQYHTILIDENGGVWTAGYNSDGQLGRSENINSGTPNKVFEKAEGLDNVKIVAASGGTAHTVLLDESGNVWTAGNNLHGQLGRQTAKNKDSKFEKVTDGISGVKITAIAAGSYYTVLLDESGNVWTVGSNGYGELGRATEGTLDNVFGKADLQGATGAKFIAACGSATVVIDIDGNARTCGINSGHLGRPVTESNNPELLKVENGIGNTKMVAAAIGTYHTVLLDENGGMWTCGKNQSGQICRTDGFREYATVAKTFAPVTDGIIQTMTFDEMKNTVINSDREFTVTAVLREKATLEYDLGGGKWVDGFTPDSFTYRDEELVLPDATKLEKRGHTFAGWETSEPTADTIKCTAKWTANTYKVTLDGNGGRPSHGTMTVTYGEELDQMPVPEYPGYIFDGWFDQQYGGKQYGDENGRSTRTYDKTEDCTLYAMWVEAPRRTITFDPNGGTLNGPTTSEEKENGPICYNPEPVREGYFFLGWYKDADCTDKWNFSDPVKGDMTLYAGWQIMAYEIRVKPENGESDIIIYKLYGTPITPPTLTRTGYIFAGWDKEFPTAMPAYDMTITAKWTLCDHTGNTAHPTCTEPVACTVCGGSIPAIGHDFSVEQHDENEHWNKCSRCDEIADKEPHEWNNGEVTMPPTCLGAGKKVYTCTKCGATKTEHIDANGHNFVFHEGKPATCAEKGWEDYHTCADCDYTDYKEIPATGDHRGGKATCTKKAVCEVCGNAYGDVDPDNHDDLRHVEAKAATKESEGNIEYWYCSGCGKYYGDAEATKKITKEETVTKKLPDEPEPPKTGIGGNLMLWLALLLLSGGICAGLIVKRRKTMLTRR